MRLVGCLFAATLAVACSANNNVGPSGASGSTDAGADTSTRAEPTSPPDAGGRGEIVDSGPPHPSSGPPTFCGAVPGQWRTFADKSEVVALISRRWILCSEGIAAPIPGQAGLDLGSDGTFRILERDASGALVPTTSPDGLGTYQLVQGPVTGQLNQGSSFQLELDAQSGAQYAQLMAVVTESPRTMLMTPLGTRVIGYVPENDTGWPETEVPQPSQGKTQPPPAACMTEPGTGGDAAPSADASSSDAGGAEVDAGDVTASIEGDWLLCSGAPLGLRTDYAGVRFEANGRYESLVWDGTGAIAAATDLFDSGEYAVGLDHGAGLQGLELRYGFFNGYTTDFDRAQLPDRLTLFVTPGGPVRSVFIRRSLTGN